MPTILFIHGWRFFIYPNEGNEPIHVHCEKGEEEAKYWLNRESFEVEESYSYNMSPRDKRQVREIIFDFFDVIEAEWDKLHGE